MKLPGTILVPIDFSEEADKALAYAIELAAMLDASIQLLHVVGIPPLGQEMGIAYASSRVDEFVAEAQATLDTRADQHRGRATFAPTRVEVGDPRDVIDRIAETIGADLIIMGTHGRRGLGRAIMGSIAESVLRTAPCPVLVLRSKRS